ncbi:MAG: hypothetical protein WA906_06825 [Pacificimonas sp.]
MRIVVTASAVIALSACAATHTAPQQATLAILEAAPIGPDENCLRLRDIESTEGVGSRAMLFRLRSGELYRSEFPASCPFAGRDDPFTYTTPSAQICGGELLQYTDRASGIGNGSCNLGEFTPINPELDPA